MLKEIKDGDQKRDKDLARLDTTVEEIKVMISGMTLQFNEVRSQMNHPEGGVNRTSILGNPGDNSGESSALLLNNHSFRYATKLEFPKFNGTDVEEWLFKIDQFFMLDKTLEHSKINIVALHLKGAALHWHKSYLEIRGRMPNWKEYVGALRGRFGIFAYEDPMAELKRLKQTDTLQEYVKSFEGLLDRAQLSGSQALSCFLAGLKHELEVVVRMFNPKNLQDAFALAKLQDFLKNNPAVQVGYRKEFC